MICPFAELLSDLESLVEEVRANSAQEGKATVALGLGRFLLKLSSGNPLSAALDAMFFRGSTRVLSKRNHSLSELALLLTNLEDFLKSQLPLNQEGVYQFARGKMPEIRSLLELGASHETLASLLRLDVKTFEEFLEKEDSEQKGAEEIRNEKPNQKQTRQKEKEGAERKGEGGLEVDEEDVESVESAPKKEIIGDLVIFEESSTELESNQAYLEKEKERLLASFRGDLEELHEKKVSQETVAHIFGVAPFVIRDIWNNFENC